MSVRISRESFLRDRLDDRVDVVRLRRPRFLVHMLFRLRRTGPIFLVVLIAFLFISSVCIINSPYFYLDNYMIA